MKVYLFPATIFVVGAVLIFAFYSAPRYTNPNWRNNVPELDSAAFYHAQEANLSFAGRYADIGIGLFSLGASLLVGLALLRVRQFNDLVNLKTPSSRVLLLAVAAITWLSFIPAEWLWLSYTLNRGDYPWWSDTIAIPIAGAAIFGAVGLPVVVGGLAVCLWRSRLPADFWRAPIGIWGWFTTVVLALVIVIAFVVLISGVAEGNPFTTPLTVIVIYLLLCGRAVSAQAPDVRHDNASQ
jgi:hypothetical protein